MKEMKTLNGYEIVDEKARSMCEELAPKADALYIVKSTNLLNLDAVVTGYLGNSGNVDSTATNYATTDFIPCEPGDVIRHQFDLNGKRYDNEVYPGYNSMARVCAYDADKNYIQGSLRETTPENPLVVYQVPDGAYYVRITYKKSGWNTGSYANSAIIISDSTEVVPFDEYQAPTTLLKEEALPVGAIDKIVEEHSKNIPLTEVGVNSVNLYDKNASYDGYYIDKTAGITANDEYTATDYIPVHGLAYIYTSSINHVAASHGAFYDENKNWIAILNPNQATTQFTVPEGAYYVRMTVYPAAKDEAVISASPVTGYVPYCAEAILADHVDVKKNNTLTFFGKVFAFEELTIGHGKNAYGGSYVTIDNTNVNVYNSREAENLVKQAAHGLTITDFISVLIEVKVKAKITILTASGSFTVEDVTWEGCNGTIFATGDGVNLDSKMAWVCADLTENIWVFGDSYLGLTGPRYPRYLLEYGYDNWLACGYPGAHANTQYPCFENLLELGRPQVAVWGLGMNDQDSGAINASWMENTQAFIALCEENGIEPILATIPNAYNGTTVLRDNSYKNAWVRNSGYRYIDFQTAVEKADGTGWYDGMLSTDGVHPDTLGAIALAHRFIRDVPEICATK